MCKTNAFLSANPLFTKLSKPSSRSSLNHRTGTTLALAHRRRRRPSPQPPSPRANPPPPRGLLSPAHPALCDPARSPRDLLCAASVFFASSTTSPGFKAVWEFGRSFREVILVKIVKCTVKNIAVDISFNQMVGLFALHFLEQVNEIVGKNHLFKHSILLVKAWCYYESRILGAHHGLFSTYAVEILVLYIINRYHASLRGPLEVLYRFLDYYGKFDWSLNYVSIEGLIALSSLPEIVEIPEADRGELLLNKEFLKNSREMHALIQRQTTLRPLDSPPST